MTWADQVAEIARIRNVHIVAAGTLPLTQQDGNRFTSRFERVHVHVSPHSGTSCTITRYEDGVGATKVQVVNVETIQNLRVAYVHNMSGRLLHDVCDEVESIFNVERRRDRQKATCDCVAADHPLASLTICSVCHMWVRATPPGDGNTRT